MSLFYKKLYLLKSLIRRGKRWKKKKKGIKKETYLSEWIDLGVGGVRYDLGEVFKIVL